jgi:hypothetical protein
VVSGATISTGLIPCERISHGPLSVTYRRLLPLADHAGVAAPWVPGSATGVVEPDWTIARRCLVSGKAPAGSAKSGLPPVRVRHLCVQDYREVALRRDRDPSRRRTGNPIGVKVPRPIKPSGVRVGPQTRPVG